MIDIGSPGYYVLCDNGHEIGVIEDGLCWNDDMFKKLEDLEKKKCPICDKKAKYRFLHYGSVNDCIPVKLVWDNKENRWIIPKVQKENLALVL